MDFVSTRGEQNAEDIECKYASFVVSEWWSLAHRPYVQLAICFSRLLLWILQSRRIRNTSLHFEKAQRVCLADSARLSGSHKQTLSGTSASQPAMIPEGTSSSSLTAQPHDCLSSVQRSTQSLMTQFFHEVHRCESMIEAENDRLRRHLSYVSDIVERHQACNSKSGDYHALSLIRVALANEHADRDLELFGKRYTTRSKLQRDLKGEMQTMMHNFAAITTAMEIRAASQLQELIDVSSAIECELEDSVARLEGQLTRERYQSSKLKTEIQALASGFEAYQLSAQRKINRLELLRQREQAKKHECELDLDTFRARYEAQQWSAYQGAAERCCVEAELHTTREKLVFLEIENDQLRQHIRALDATIEHFNSQAKSEMPSQYLALVDFEHQWQRKSDHWTHEAFLPGKSRSANDFLSCAFENEGRPELDVSVDDVCILPVCSYLDSELQAGSIAVSTSQFSSTNRFVAVEYGDRVSDDETKAAEEWCFPAVIVCIDDVCMEVNTSYVTELRT